MKYNKNSSRHKTKIKCLYRTYLWKKLLRPRYTTVLGHYFIKLYKRFRLIVQWVHENINNIERNTFLT